MSNFIDYNPTEFIQKLRTLDPATKPNWGVMTPQHMVEHLIIIFKMSNGSIPAELYIAEKEIPANQQYLRSEQEFDRNIRIKGLNADKPRPLRMENMQDAIDKLEKEMKRFEDAFSKNPDQEIVHPMFGPLDYDDWVQFHRKHTTHHFKQFGLVE